jgi:hypothetical protein
VSNDKAFATWAALIIAGAGLLLTTLVTTGVATLPSLGSFLDHVVLGLGVRFAYKWVGGFDWADWSVLGDAAEATVASADVGAPGAPA